jgi:hypothetical protein
MPTWCRRVVTLVLLAAAAALGGSAADAAERPTPAQLRSKLMPLYHAVKADSRLHKVDAALAGKLSASAVAAEPAALDEVLKLMPLSPLAYLEIDMQLQRYEIAVPRFIAEAHVRWIELHEKEARAQYGDVVIDKALTRLPADTGPELIGLAEASISSNRNVAATASPLPLDYQGEIQLVVNPANSAQVVAAANTWHAAGTACNNQETQAIFYSSNSGDSWSYTCAPSANAFALGSCAGTVFGSDPALAWDDGGNVYLNYMLLCSTTLTTRYAMVVARSTDAGATWAARGVIKNSWAATSVEDKNFYTIDTTPTSPFFGRHYTCWDRNNNEKIAYSTTTGSSWTEVDLPTAASGSYDLGCEIAVAADGAVHVVFDTLDCGTTTCTNERMFYTRSTNGGVSWSTPTLVRDFNLVSFSSAAAPPVADERGINPFGSIDVDNSGGSCNGTLYVTYSDFASGSVADNDVWVARSTNGGSSWSAAVKVNDDGLAGRIQFHPFLTVDQTNGSVVVGWHDARNDAANKKVDYYVARSTNCGVSFEANVKASQNSSEFNNSGISYTDENTADNPNNNPNQYGEYMGVAAHGNKAYLAWTDTRHFYPGSSTEAQKENLGFALVDFGTGGGPVCGNGIVETGESCDGTNLSGQTCVGLGFAGGTLACSGSCSFDTSGCTTGQTTTTFVSVAAEDGRVLESSETSGTGGTVNSSANTTSAIRAGDDSSDRQYKGFVSFDTSTIPDGAAILSVTLRLRRGTVSGTNPFGTHGAMRADVSSAFGGAAALAASDFQAAAAATAVCTLSNAAANLSWSECSFNASGLAAINKAGRTQVRVQFASDDNDDRGTDYIGYYSGNSTTAGNRPQLVVTYQ